MTNLLLGDLLSIMQGLERGVEVETAQAAVVPALDEILDRSKFSVPENVPVPQAEPWDFQNSVDAGEAKSENVFRQLPQLQLEKLLRLSRENNTTMTAVLSAAIAMAYMEMQQRNNGLFDLFTAIDLRPYTEGSPVANNILAFYANMLLTSFDLSKKQDFGSLATMAKVKLNQALKEYQLPSADDDVLMNGLLEAQESSLKNKQFFASTVLSNLGVVDSAFENLADSYSPDSFYCSLNLSVSLFGMIIYTTTINGKLCFVLILISLLPRLKRFGLKSWRIMFVVDWLR